MAKGSPIIIKKIKKGGHGGHHGGAWKVAYADFVTAMMAFFLLMWLLNATSETQKRGLSNYFGPTGDMIAAGGSGGILGGTAIDSEGSFDDSKINSAANYSSAPDEAQKDKETEGESNTSKPVKEEVTATGLEEKAKLTDTKNIDGKEVVKQAAQKKAEDLIAKKESMMFKDAEKLIKKAIQESPELKELAKNLIIEETPEGLRIQIVDKERYSMFPSGKSQMFEHTKKLIQKVARVISQMPNKISIAGHTDGKPYNGDSDYGNWELSTDRANATRRELKGAAYPEDKILTVVGKADKDPFVPNDPMDEKNRRISITLLRMYGK